ncbi:uncharacterized protein B0H18DRAFT_977555 [Fomitopsis serialis]|uniref:uncharacterized protein n=1 Tax=Fomitopsis serialis TaxID=139415 RepID=UPI0020073DCE|nr:uncharacterized protein B0H18DRAFT_977555 [Neoantrodia serialis]KAH9934650.1 hypothetical protein B0H18DRAFT_977555 [Neoantrodia serialis]
MRNPFVLLRFVLFFFLLYLNILALGFASWNIAAAKRASLNEGGAPVFVLFNTILTIIYLLLANLPGVLVPKIILECVWIAAFAILELSAAIVITVNGPILACRAEDAMSACASSTLLVVVTWVTSFLRTSAVPVWPDRITTMHSNTHPDVWGAAITSVPWFAASQSPPPSSGKQWFYPKDPERQDFESPAFKDNDAIDLEADGHHPALSKAISISAPFSKSVESFRPTWAKDVKPRRGVDPPFLSPKKSQKSTPRLLSHWSCTTVSTYAPPVLPPKTVASGKAAVRRGRAAIPSQMSLPVITPSPSRPMSYGIFPEDVQDPDMPIKPCHRSEWVRADSESR